MIDNAAADRMVPRISSLEKPSTPVHRATISRNWIRLSMAIPRKPSMSPATNRGWARLAALSRC